MARNDPECERSGLPQSMCAHCRGLDDEVSTSGLRVDRFVTASYPGRCAADPDHVIDVGTTIGHAIDDEGNAVGWICGVCAGRMLG